MEAHWTQQQAIDFECVRDVITDCIGILNVQIYAETDPIKLQALRNQSHAFSQERNSLHVNDDLNIAVARAKYDAFFIENMS
ncbi:hypothetical protein [Undibacterium sp.]|uniref:hypothetical protein n=1 Tax=Undibacterium sp. TaxID=1914977 RepID=UPI00375206CC